jgi:hypothetical protein
MLSFAAGGTSANQFAPELQLLFAPPPSHVTITAFAVCGLHSNAAKAKAETEQTAETKE